MRRSLALASDDLFKRTLHPLQITYFSLYILQMFARHAIGIGARPIRMMNERKQFANLVDSEAELSAATNER
ncbi:hypothetical protein WM40_21470 [Robbsia andropogonis]|uniref:Uncharacterized protein n=1 Tax=Robbsia andropogonis TaxID=28092 RepID=A0A0F5JVN7_9BURK|nr:hypothetical protein WM40_21470 [Robbsia andropogonis]